ncbi:MAG: DNA polymerase III subunit gamma/tau [Nitrospirae bacterium]|nr:DNA polymerase III subunit gamma/tau [Magnetococcales bacterium]HAT51135.1 DNA polymerase III, subunit gamma and tau [Alphaproteobacteria bacterium]
MSNYVVLARRWRPRSFETLIGQDHVTRALIHALDSGRLSHAFLFSGIRGTGKTTLARLLALCLNCEQGTTSKPCGVCGSCREIIAGNHPDVLEVDAASRTKVEQMRELLDMVGYAPTHSRFRIFILDEVHMLSVPSFNALLKTLEEPPGHVKFLFATTELRKLPATILSRCQRYELKRVSEETLCAHMSRILEQETIPFENNALQLVATAAEGSVRDALSLLDQVISHGSGTVAFETVSQLLGLTNRESTLGIIAHLLTGDGKKLLAALTLVYQNGVEPESMVRDILAALHAEVRAKVTLSDADDPGEVAPTDHWKGLVRTISLEHLQMVYMVLNKGGQELRLTDHPWRALEMLLLRACYLAPIPDLKKLIRVLGSESGPGGGSAMPTETQGPSMPPSSQPVSAAAPLESPHVRQSQSGLPRVETVQFPEDWDRFIAFVGVKHKPLAMKLSTQLACLEFRCPDDQQSGRIALQWINDCFGTSEGIRKTVEDFIVQMFDVKVEIVVHAAGAVCRPETLQERDSRVQEEAMGQLERDIRAHPDLRALTTRFNAEILSIAPVEHRSLH